MNVINNKNWYARVNKMPSLEGPTFTASGIVTVENSAIEASLAISKVQDKSLGLRLDVVLENCGNGQTVLTDKPVSLSVPGYGDTTHVTIFHDGKELVRINEVPVVY